jgi:hypothetical protein
MPQAVAHSKPIRHLIISAIRSNDMHSLGALIRRGSVSRRALYPAGREEEEKKREERRVWPQVISSPGFFIWFFLKIELSALLPPSSI